MNSFEKFLLNIPPNSKLLEVGCGDCNKLIAINSSNSKITLYGCDKIIPKNLPNFIRFNQIDLETEKLPFEDNFFDAVIMIHVLEHLIKYDLTFEEIYRVLKKDGLFYVETPNTRSLLVPSFRFKYDQGVPFNFYDDPSHIRPFSSTSLFYLLRYYNFEVIEFNLTRKASKIPISIFRALKSLIKGNRAGFAVNLWQIIGWSSYAVGKKL